MKCPGCREPLVVIEMNEVEVDWCAACQGVWLDAGELELLRAKSPGASELSPALQPVSESGSKTGSARPPHRCPICDRRMTFVTDSQNPGVVLDRCSKGDGLWFDRGELAEVLRLREAGDSIADFLGGIFKSKA